MKNSKHPCLSFIGDKNILAVILSLIAFLAPVLIGHPAQLVGVIVNAALVLAALRLDKIRAVPLIVMPGLGSLSRSLLFGPFNPFQIYIIPLVWVGNGLLVFAFRLRLNRWLAMPCGAVLKTAFLFSGAFLLVSMKLLPAPVLDSMGFLQIYTAIIGGGIALFMDASFGSENL
jgi:hypothetical protein